jgi:receptor protein-tyrosine kinase
LIARSPGEFDRLADALLAVGAQGKKVLGIAGCRQGEGATTMLLCAARRLADRGVKLAILDADLARPRLAKRLGVQPELGWNETTGETDDTDASLERAAVEAAANGLTLAPIQELAAPTAWTSAGWARLAECLKTLRSHFEMTLVDLGPLEGIQHVGDSLHRTIASELDAVLLIRNQRITSNEQLSIAQKELSAAGVVLAGLIENFIAE